MFILQVNTVQSVDFGVAKRFIMTVNTMMRITPPCCDAREIQPIFNS